MSLFWVLGFNFSYSYSSEDVSEAELFNPSVILHLDSSLL